jgi:serine/threonine-protein kinase ULK/ATG1
MLFFYFRIPSSTSLELTDLIIRILKRNPKERIDYEDFFNHPFLIKSKGKKTRSIIIDLNNSF